MTTGAQELGGTAYLGSPMQGQSAPPRGDARRALRTDPGPRAGDSEAAAGREGGSGPVVITWWPKLCPPRDRNKRPIWARFGTERRGTWARLFEALSRPMPAFLGDAHPGWSAASFEGGVRSLETVRACSAIVLDYDNKDGSNVAIDRGLFAFVGAARFAYTTKSCTLAAPRWRLVLPLSRLVTAEEQARVWTWAAARLAEEGIKLDSSTRDASRFWYWPCRTSEQYFETGGELGPLLHVEEVLELARALAAAAAPPPAPRRPPPPPSSSSYLSPIERARAYLERIPGAISGQGGHPATFLAAQHAVRGFQLDEGDALCVLREWNRTCQPPWSDRDLLHKIRQAARHGNAVEWGQHLREGAR